MCMVMDKWGKNYINAMINYLLFQKIKSLEKVIFVFNYNSNNYSYIYIYIYIQREREREREREEQNEYNIFHWFGLLSEFVIHILN